MKVSDCLITTARGERLTVGELACKLERAHSFKDDNGVSCYITKFIRIGSEDCNVQETMISFRKQNEPFERTRSLAEFIHNYRLGKYILK